MARNSDASGRGGPFNIALFDSRTLVGKGVRTHLVSRKFPAGEVTLYDTGAVEEGGNLAEFAGEARLASRPELESMESVDIAFFCGEVGAAKAYLEWPVQGGFVAIDLTSSANGRCDVPVVNASVNPEAVLNHSGILSSPNPTSQFLSTFLASLSRKLAIAEVVSVVMQPASETGESGIEELYRQTVGLLSFTQVPKESFGQVLAFNLVPASLGPRGPAVEERVAREVGAILGGERFTHAVRILLAPVFHCHAFSTWVRFAEEVSPERVRGALAEEPSIRIRQGSGGATPAELAGEEKIVVAEIRPDPTTPGAFWFWGISDNLATGTALNAVRIAEELVSSRSLRRRTP